LFSPLLSPRLLSYLFFSLLRPPPRSTLFPYTTLFRSFPSTAAVGPTGSARPLRPDLQRRDLQLPRAAVRARTRPRRRVRDRRGRRTDPRRVPPSVGRGRAGSAGHVRLRDLGHRGASPLRGPGPVRDQTPVPRDGPRRDGVREREEVDHG